MVYLKKEKKKKSGVSNNVLGTFWSAQNNEYGDSFPSVWCPESWNWVSCCNCFLLVRGLVSISWTQLSSQSHSYWNKLTDVSHKSREKVASFLSWLLGWISSDNCSKKCPSGTEKAERLCRQEQIVGSITRPFRQVPVSGSGQQFVVLLSWRC